MKDRKKLAVIHIVKKELGLSDAEYREILRREAGVESSKDLDERSFRRLMSYFVRSRFYRHMPGGVTLRQKLYMKFLMRKLGWDEGHLDGFIHKFYHKDEVDYLSRREAVKAIESLKHVLSHRTGKR